MAAVQQLYMQPKAMVAMVSKRCKMGCLQLPMLQSLAILPM